MSPLHSNEFRLPSGRSVYLSALHMRFTFEGALEGSPQTLTRHLRPRLAQSVQKTLPSGMPLVLIGAEAPVLPEYQWVAQLFSRRGVKTEDSDFNSHLALCWFSDGVYRDLPDAIEEILLQVDWEGLAADYDIMP